MSSTTPQSILITGANTGLGLETLRSLLSSPIPYRIFLGTRSISNGDTALSTLHSEFPSTTSTLELIQVDLSSDSSLESAVGRISDSTSGTLDVLINNAGASFDNDKNLSLRDRFNKSWDTNVSGTQVLTTLCVPLLLNSASPRLLFVTSGTASLSETEDLDTETGKRLNASPAKGWPKQGVFDVVGYRSAKTGLNMVMREWYKLLKNDGVKVWCISPGFLATGLGRVGPEVLKKMGAIDPKIGGDFVRDVVEGKHDEHVGKIIRKDMVQPW